MITDLVLEPKFFRSSLLYVEDSPQNSPSKRPTTKGQQVPETPGNCKVWDFGRSALFHMTIKVTFQGYIRCCYWWWLGSCDHSMTAKFPYNLLLPSFIRQLDVNFSSTNLKIWAKILVLWTQWRSWIPWHNYRGKTRLASQIHSSPTSQWKVYMRLWYLGA